MKTRHQVQTPLLRNGRWGPLAPSQPPAGGDYRGVCLLGYGLFRLVSMPVVCGCALRADSRKATAGEGSLYPLCLMRSAPPAPLTETGTSFLSLPGRPPPPGMLENSELAANSRKKEYSVSLPLCLAGFWLIKGGVPFWPGAKMAHS
jgi:hypothetical protein